MLHRIWAQWILFLFCLYWVGVMIRRLPEDIRECRDSEWKDIIPNIGLWIITIFIIAYLVHVVKGLYRFYF